MKPTFGLALALIAAGGLGYFFGIWQNREQKLPANQALSRSGQAGREAEIDETPPASPRFYQQLALLRKTEKASLEELWDRFRIGGLSKSDEALVVDRLVSLDAEAAIQLAKKSGEKRRLATLMHAWSRKEPVAAFRYLEQLPEFGDDAVMAEMVCQTALRLAIQQGDQALIFEVLGQTTQFGPEPFHQMSSEQVIGFLDLLAEKKFRHSSVELGIAALAKEDYEAAQQWVASHADEGSRSRQWRKALLKAGLAKDFADGWDSALAYVAENPDDESFRTHLIYAAAKKDPSKGAALLREHSREAMPVPGLVSVAANFLARVPEDQREAITNDLEQRGIQYKRTRSGRQFNLIDEQAMRDLLTPEARERIEATQNPFIHVPLDAEKAAQILSETDPAGVAPQIANAVANNYAGSDPEAALAWAAGLDDSLSLPAARAALSRWVALDADAAMDYAVQLPESEFQSAAAEAIVQKRIGLDRGATREWVEGIDATPFRDAAAAYFVSTADSKEVTALIPMAGAIGHEALRREALLHLLDRWPDGSGEGLLTNPAISVDDRKFLKEAAF